MAAVGREPGVAAGLFRPLSADDEEQLPTELESLCMACFRRVRARGFPGLPEGRGCRGARPGLSLSLPSGRHAAPADQDPVLPGGHRRLLRLRQLRLDQRRDPVGRAHPGARGPLRPGRQEPAGGRLRTRPAPKGGQGPVSGRERGRGAREALLPPPPGPGGGC